MRGYKGLGSIALMGAFLLMGMTVYAAEEASDGAKEAAKVKDDDPGPWYFFLGNVNNQPRLKRAERLADRQINEPFRLIAPTFEDVKTFADQRDDFMIWSPFIGVGRLLSERWDTFFQMGYSAGKVRTNENYWPSLMLLPFHADVTEHRSSFFAGLGLAYYPWMLPERDKYDSIGQRLRHAKPFVMTTLSWNRLTFEAKVKAGFQPFKHLIHTVQKDDWTPMSSGIALGVDIPMSKSTSISMNVQYTFFWEEEEDFSGPGLSFLWKKYF